MPGRKRVGRWVDQMGGVGKGQGHAGAWRGYGRPKRATSTCRKGGAWLEVEGWGCGVIWEGAGMSRV